MKSKLNLLLLIGCVTLVAQLLAQDNPPPATNSAATPVTNEPAAAPAVVDAIATSSPTPAATNESVTTAVTTNVTTNITTSVTTSVTTEPAPVPVAEVPAATTEATPATNAAPRDPNIIPLIQFVDVPLTAAIENLARQAGINYILDPKIGYGQAGADGKSMPQPSISIRWENLTAEQALYAVLNNYDLQLSIDPKTKITRIAPKDPALPDPLISKVIQLKYASPSNVVAAVQGSLIDRRSRVIPDTRTSKLVVVATEKEMNSVEELIAQLDAPTRQVLIEAHLMETSRNPTTVKGIDWTGTLQAQHVSFGNGVLSGTSTTPNSSSYTLPSGVSVSIPGPIGGTPTTSTVLGNGGFNWNTLSGFNPAVGFLNADGASAVISFLNSDTDTKVISTPRTITLDNETADLSVTRASPIINVSPGSANNAGGSQISYTNLGTILKVTPHISANDFIQLKVTPEVSSIAGTVTKTISIGTGSGIFQADEYDIRRIDTQVLIPSGNTLVMGGLMTDQSSKGYAKVPILGDMPFFGLAFRHENKSQQQRNLIVFVTPTIVKDTDYQPAQTDFLKTKRPTSTPSKISAWNSGKPVDWSKSFSKKPTE